MKKMTALAISLLLVGFGTTACGGDGAADAPKDASVEDFCGALRGYDLEADDANVADYIDDMKQVGTPADMPDDARKGFEFMIEKATELDDKKAELGTRADFETEFGLDSTLQFIALFTYISTKCNPLPTQ